ncbi:MAG TPA: 5-methyltetrahydropteroyltriglutamate--homocysteine S-methyltransferase, partial [Candidatus Kapabacteria bacterium]|nr:5-methyltetrahydropteroyltriglutamate--homocysteine S-methyltransferase [Candidatus Kapabacteria bacterium]
MALSQNLGYPRVGAKRELKKANEGFWTGKVSQAELLKTASDLRAAHWNEQKAAGIDLIPSNDFSFYDHVLDTSVLVGAVPARYHWDGGNVSLETYFAMARGSQTKNLDVPAMEMTKWFDTNYHYIVPEFTKNQAFKISSTKPFDEFNEAKALGIKTKPVLVGPV